MLLLNQLKEDLKEFYGWVVDHNNDLKTSVRFLKQSQN